SGFGCVLCRAALYEYEHFDPPFAEAYTHSADGICLLCPSCHSLRTKERIPVREIRRAYDDLSRRSDNRPPFDDQFFKSYSNRFHFEIGGSKLEGFGTIIELDGRPVLSILPGDGTPPFWVSGQFNDDFGRP